MCVCLLLNSIFVACFFLRFSLSSPRHISFSLSHTHTHLTLNLGLCCSHFCVMDLLLLCCWYCRCYFIFRIHIRLFRWCNAYVCFPFWNEYFEICTHARTDTRIESARERERDSLIYTHIYAIDAIIRDCI